MPFVFGTGTRVWMDGRQAACVINELTQEAEIEEAEVTTLCSTLKDYIPGLAEVTVELEGYFDTNTASPTTTMESLFHSRISTGNRFPVTFAPEGGADTGDSVYLMNGFLQEYSIEATVDEAAAVEATFRATTSLSRAQIIERGAIARVNTNHAGTTVGVDVLDSGAASTNGGVIVLQIFEVTGTTPSFTPVLQHATSPGGTWTDLLGFGAYTSVQGIYATVAPGTTVNRYLRMRWTNVTGTSPSFKFNAAFKRN